MVEDRILLLSFLPVSDMNCGQLSGAGLQHHCQGGLERMSICFHPRCNRLDCIIKDGFNPWLRDSGEIFFHLRFREVVLHAAQEIGHCVILPFLVFQGEVIVGQFLNPVQACHVQGGR